MEHVQQLTEIVDSAVARNIGPLMEHFKRIAKPIDKKLADSVGPSNGTKPASHGEPQPVAAAEGSPQLEFTTVDEV